MKAASVGKKTRCVSLIDVYLRRKFFLLPPIMRERERAAVHCKIQVRETVPGENPAVAQPCPYFSAAHRIQDNFASIQIQCRNAGCCRDYEWCNRPCLTDRRMPTSAGEETCVMTETAARFCGDIDRDLVQIAPGCTLFQQSAPALSFSI